MDTKQECKFGDLEHLHSIIHEAVYALSQESRQNAHKWLKNADQLIHEIIEKKDNQWTSVDKELPKQRGRYLIIEGNKIGISYFEPHDSGLVWMDCEYNEDIKCRVTYWMSFPDLPKNVSL